MSCLPVPVIKKSQDSQRLKIVPNLTIGFDAFLDFLFQINAISSSRREPSHDAYVQAQ
jgi:hypothetical protein